MAQKDVPKQPVVDKALGAPQFDAKQVAEALLHFARLAASGAGGGVGFLDSDTFSELATDQRARQALDEATRILLRDRERLHRKVARGLVSRVHQIVAVAFGKVPIDVDVDAEVGVEDEIEHQLTEQLGLVPTRDERRWFAVDRQYITEMGGPVAAAAAAIGKAFGRETGSVIHNWIARAKGDLPLPAPLDRWVPLREVRRYLAHVIEAAEGERKAATILPLGALLSADHAESLMDRVEAAFRKRTRLALDAGKDDVKQMFRAMLRGQDPGSNVNLSDALSARWGPIRAHLAAIGLELGRLDADRTLVTLRDGKSTTRVEAFVEILTQFSFDALGSAFDVP
jgi:hypothetical protein